MITHVETLEEFQKILKDAGDKLVVVDFTASWCGPCQRIGPKFKEESEHPDNKNVIFLKVDVDDCQEVSTFCEIRSMPTFYFYKNGRLIHNFSGADAEELVKQLKTLRT